MKKGLVKKLVRGAIIVVPVLVLAACAQKAAEEPMGPTLEEVAAKADAAMAKADAALTAARAAEEAANRAAAAAERVEAMFQKSMKK